MRTRKVECFACPNLSCLVRKNCFPEHLDMLEQKKIQTVFKKGSSIFEAGNPVVGLHIVQTGIIGEFISSQDYKFEIIRFSNDGQTFGPAGFEDDVYPFSAVAKEDAVVCFFNNKVLIELNVLNPSIIFDLMLFYSRQYNKTAFRLRCNSLMNLREKIAHALYFLYQRFGLNNEGELRECFSREDIASLACTTAEQVSRQLTDFEKEKIIEKRSRKIAVLHPVKLKHIIQHYLIN